MFNLEWCGWCVVSGLQIHRSNMFKWIYYIYMIWMGYIPSCCKNELGSRCTTTWFRHFRPWRRPFIWNAPSVTHRVRALMNFILYSGKESARKSVPIMIHHSIIWSRSERIFCTWLQWLQWYLGGSSHGLFRWVVTWFTWDKCWVNPLITEVSPLTKWDEPPSTCAFFLLFLIDISVNRT